MTNPSVDALKNEVADCYIKNFQKELGWLKGMVILPLKSGMKDILTGKAELPENFKEIENFKFWKYIIQFFSKDLANKIFDFLKTKRQEIVSRQTVSQLLELKNEILGIKNPEQNNNGSQQTNNATAGTNNGNEGGNNSPEQNNDRPEGMSPVMGGAATSAVGTYGTYKFKQWAEGHDVEKVVKKLDDKQIKGTIESAIETMKKQKEALGSRLTPRQIKTVEKHINELQKGLDEMDSGSVSDLLRDWYAVREKLPEKLLRESFDESLLKQIDNLSDQLHGKSIDEIKRALGITSSDESLDSLLKCISETRDAKQIRQMTKVIRGGNKLSKFAKTFAGAMRLDVAFAGLDVWVYMNSEKEAELISKINQVRGENKHNQAVFQLRTGLGSVVAEGLIILGICAAGGSYGGPIGTVVGLAVGAAAWGLSEAGNALYYDVKDFYLQNDEDFLRQSRGKIKQSILQGIHNYKNGDTSLNETFTTWASTHNVVLDFVCPQYGVFFDRTNEEDLSKWLDAKETSLKSACRSMIFLEEIEDGTDELKNNSYLLDYVNSRVSKDEFLKDKDDEYKQYFNEYREKMASRIDKRMEYVNKEFEKNDIIDSIYAGAGVQRLTQIFTESKGYANMSDNDKRDDSKTYSENLQSYKADFFKDFPAEKLEKLELIRKDNPSLFLDIITTTSLSTFIGEGEEISSVDENYRLNVELVEAYKKYVNMFENLEDKHYLYIDNEYKNGRFIHNLLKADFDIDRVEYPTMESDNQLLDLVGLGCERRGLTEISDNMLQNILYKLAKQLNGYSGMNDMYELMKFYGEEEGGNNGIYFSSKRKINRDWAIDTKLVDNIPKTLHESDIEVYVNRFMKRSFYNFAGGQKSIIDTAAESIDDQLTAELVSVIENIVREELKNHTVENQNRIKEKIKSVVKENSKGEFMELPYYWILEAKKAGLGDLQRQFFRRNQRSNVVEICYMNKEYNTTSIFGDDCEKLYISAARDRFTEDEKAYIDRVDAVCEKLRQIKGVEGWGLTQAGRHEDDLDLPVEIEHIISDKMIERENFKDTVLLYDARTCNSAAIIDKYKEYAEYFESVYRGILFSEAGFTVSNDIDSFEYFQSAMGLGSMNLFTNDGEIDIDIIKASGGKGFDFLLNDANNEFISFYQNLYKTLQFKTDVNNAEESLEYRWKQGNSDQKQMARRVSYDIITTTFEKCILMRDGYGNVSGISHGMMGHRNELKEDIELDVKKHIKEMKVQSNIDINKINPLLHEKEIIKLTQGEKQVTDLTPIIEELIKENLPQVDWSDRRLQLQYDVEDSSVNSRGEKTEISIEEPENGSGGKIKISGLNIEFTSLKEGVRTANLINWLKYNMRKEPIGKPMPRIHPDANLDKYKRESDSLVREVNKTPNDIEVLTRDILDGWYPTIKNNNEFLRFINNLLEFISSDNGGFTNNGGDRDQWDDEQSVPSIEPEEEEHPWED